MYINYDWLKEFVKTNASAEKSAQALTMAIAEVEGIKKPGDDLDKIVVGRVERIYPHPNADKLQLVDVNIGQQDTTRVVCGASNIYEGMLVIFTPVGAKVKWHGEGEWITLQPARIRGEESFGMIAMAAEVGLSAERDPENGVVDLSYTKARPGTPLAKALGVRGTIFDIDNKSLTHRADLFNHVGLARELAAATEKSFSYAPFNKAFKGKPSGKMADVRIGGKKDCARFIGTVIEVKNGATPKVIRERLESVGVRSIGVVVDVTNFVMLEMGQPTHAFDYDKLLQRADGKKPAITVRRAKPGEEITTLDGVVRKLDASVQVVADQKGPIAIAGIMGGKDTEVDDQTTRILLEAARFEPIITRTGAQKAGLRTEAVMRFEKGLPRELPGYATQRCIELLKRHANGKVVDGPIDIYVDKWSPYNIALDPEHASRIIGMPIAAAEIKKILKRLGIGTTGVKKITATIPWWRPDLRLAEDLIEEVARIKGYENIPEEPLMARLEPVDEQPELQFIREAGIALAESGLTEVRHYSFYGDKERLLLNDETVKHVETLNALSEDLRYMRASLLPQMLGTIKKNQRYKTDMRLFEFGHVFGEGKEIPMLSLAVTDARNNPFLKLKGVVEHLSKKFGLTISFTKALPRTADKNLLDGQQVLTVSLGKKTVGYIAVVSDAAREKAGVETSVVVAQLDVRACANVMNRVSPYKALPKYPAVLLDLAFTLPADVLYKDVEDVINSESYGIIENIELFDVYSGRSVKKGRKSLAIHVTFRAPDRTLSRADAQAVLDKIIDKLHKTFAIEVR